MIHTSNKTLAIPHLGSLVKRSKHIKIRVPILVGYFIREHRAKNELCSKPNNPTPRVGKSKGYHWATKVELGNSGAKWTVLPPWAEVAFGGQGSQC